LDLVWAVGGGIGIGAALGALAGRWLVRRPAGELESGAGAFLGLGLLALAYGVAVVLSTYGFLAVFAAAVAVQWSVTSSSPAPPKPAGTAVRTHRNLLVLHRFYDDLESFAEFAIVILLGVLWASVPYRPESLLLGALLFFVFRPLSVVVALRGVPIGRHQMALASWFGIRGVGTLYYVLYVLNHGATGPEAERLLGLALGVVTLSIVAHGISVTPLMTRYRRAPAPSVHPDRS
jgi:NhaP-type Na+/H+ or K+/H+ antiporter